MSKKITKKSSSQSVSRNVNYFIYNADKDASTIAGKLRSSKDYSKLGEVQFISDSLSSSEELSVVSAQEFQSFCEERPNDISVLVPASLSDSIFQINSSIKGFRKMDSSSAYLMEMQQSKDKKIPVTKKIEGFFRRWLSPVEGRNLETSIIAVSNEAINKKTLDQIPQSVWKKGEVQLASWLSLLGFQIKGLPTPQLKTEELPKRTLTTILSSISTRWKWFVTQPIKDLRTSGLGGFKEGNSSLYRLFFVLIFFFSMVLLPMLSFDYGITWDEPEDRKYFKEVISYFASGGEDTRCLDETRKLHNHLVNYGPFVNLITAAANEYISPFDIYETRHLVISLFALIGLLFTGLLARKAGTWRTGVIALLLLLLTPMFFGHAMNNQKDMPFLAFYIASLFYIVRFTKEAPNPKLKTILMAGVCMGITMSIRVGGLLVFAYLVLFLGLKFLMAVRNKETKIVPGVIQYAKGGLISLVLAYIIGVIFWPAALADPIGHPLEALSNFEKFSLVHIYELFEGQRYYMKDFPWYYLPKSMLITLPLFVLAGVLIALVASPKLLKKYDKLVLASAAFALVFPIVYIIYKQSAVYSSWRHILFVLPALIIVAATGWDFLIQQKNKAIRIGSSALMALGMILVMVWMVRNHPYQYAYFNELVGGTKGAFGKYEMDYWCQTPKTAMNWLLENEGLDSKKAVVFSNNEITSLNYYADQNQDKGDELRAIQRRLERLDNEYDQLRHYQKEKIITEAEFKAESEELLKEIEPLRTQAAELRTVIVGWAREQQWNQKPWDYAIWTTRTLSRTQIENGYWPPKGTIKTIDIDGAPVCAIVKRENNNLTLANDLVKQNKLDSAVLLVKEYMEYDPLEEEAPRTLSFLHVRQGDWDNAIKYAKKSIRLRPESYFSWGFMGMAYLRSGKLDSAKYCYEEAIGFKANYSTAYDGLGDVAYSQGNTKRALDMYNKALEYSGNNAYVYYKMGEVYLNQEDLNNAANYFNAAIQTNKNFSQAYLGMYKTLDKAGQKEQAQQYLANYRKLTGQ